MISTDDDGLQMLLKFGLWLVVEFALWLLQTGHSGQVAAPEGDRIDDGLDDGSFL